MGNRPQSVKERKLLKYEKKTEDNDRRMNQTQERFNKLPNNNSKLGHSIIKGEGRSHSIATEDKVNLSTYVLQMEAMNRKSKLIL